MKQQTATIKSKNNQQKTASVKAGFQMQKKRIFGKSLKKFLETKFGRAFVIIDAPAGESLQYCLVETSRLNCFDQFLGYCYRLWEFAQRVQVDRWSAPQFDKVYAGR